MALVVKKPPANAGDIRAVGSIPGWGRSWRRKWHPTPVLLPGESHGQRRPAVCGPQGHEESDMTEAALHACTHTHQN